MNVKIVKEHPDGSVDVVLERLSNPDKEFLIHYGFQKMMQEAVETNKWVIEEEDQMAKEGEVCSLCGGTGYDDWNHTDCGACKGKGVV